MQAFVNRVHLVGLSIVVSSVKQHQVTAFRAVDVALLPYRRLGLAPP